MLKRNFGSNIGHGLQLEARVDRVRDHRGPRARGAWVSGRGVVAVPITFTVVANAHGIAAECAADA